MVVVTVKSKRATPDNIAQRCNTALKQALKHLNNGAEVKLGIAYSLQQRFPQETAVLRAKWAES